MDKLNGFIKFLSRKYRLCGLNVLKFLYTHGLFIAMLAATALTLFAKLSVAMYPTQDVVGYVLEWMKQIKEVGIGKFYTADADYSPMFLFLISLLTLLPQGAPITLHGFEFFANQMLYVKCCYFIFDILIAIAVFLIIKHITKSWNKAATGYLVAVILPVQFVNSAVWGNADSLYACLILYCVYFALKSKGAAALLLFGLALANKLQALFIAPFIVYLLLIRKIKFRTIFLAPLAVLASFIPAYICGADFLKPFEFFAKQVGGYKKLTLGCPNFWQLFAFNPESESIIANGAPFFAIAVIGVFFAIIFFRNIKPTDENLLTIAAFTVGITVFFLPHMHERYFYLVDLLVVVYALVRNKNYFLIPLMQIASGIAYYHYISGRYFIDPWGEDSVHIAALIIVFVLCFLFSHILKAEHSGAKAAVAALQGELEEIRRDT
ncbi:MAG: hypothetical protein IJX79_02190 [Clostridia bacterium]|nr:hypothetical protein [Clostridia bacterium]